MARSFDESEWDTALSSEGISVYQVATRSRVPMYMLRRVEKGRIISLSRRLAIASALSADADDLWPVDV